MAIAYFSTWTTYGTWLPGDERGWFDRNKGLSPPDLARRFQSLLRQTEGAILLTAEQRRIVEKTIEDHCGIRKWHLHAVNCRTNHVHAVLTASERSIEIPREQFKSWCTRKLKEQLKASNPLAAIRENWWTQRGWDEFIDNQEFLDNCIRYTLEGQG